MDDENPVDSAVDRLVKALREEAEEIKKGRRYISDPSEAPENANVEQGPQGGYYYEVGGESGASSVPGEGASEPAQEAVASAVVGGQLEQFIGRDEAVDLADHLAESLPSELPEGSEGTMVYDALSEWANNNDTLRGIGIDEVEQLAADIGSEWNQ